MGANKRLYTLCDAITRPRVWPRHTLEESRACQVQLINHPNSRPAGRAEAQEMIKKIDAELADRKAQGRTY